MNTALRNLVAALALCSGVAANADTIQVTNAGLEVAETRYALHADFRLDLGPSLLEALSNGLSLGFLVEFELIRPRWYWLNEKLVSKRQQYRLGYNALTRQYRVGIGTLYQNFGSLPEALAFLSRVRLRDIVETGALAKGNRYTAALRMRLDSSQLPRPFQISAVGSREWSVGSDWHRWAVSP